MSQKRRGSYERAMWEALATSHILKRLKRCLKLGSWFSSENPRAIFTSCS